MPIMTDLVGALMPSASEDPLFVGLNRLVVEGFGLPPCRRFEKCSGGLINDTYDGDGIWIVQRVNPIFGAGVNDDIAALVPLLQIKGIPVPQLCRSKTGQYAIEGKDYGLAAGNYRIMTKLTGVAHARVDDIAKIRALAQMLAAFHTALDGVSHRFVHTRPAVHDFYRHKRALTEALATKREHRYSAEIEALRCAMERCEKSIPIDDICNGRTRRIIHGDPKISNFLFSEAKETEHCSITGVIDLDTMARSLVCYDVGDAIRSWCNPRKEDEEPEYNSEFARETLGEYEESAHCLDREERSMLAFSPAYIALELAMRFARDALCEDYFGFDPEIGHAEHSARRARAMLGLCAQMLAAQTREI